MSGKFFLAVILSLAIGFGLRLTGLEHMEFKLDERRVSDAALGRSEDLSRFPLLGITSGVYFRNPGLSISSMSAIAWVSRAQDPVALARAVAFLNWTALLILALLIVKRVPPSEQLAWWIGLIITAFSPHGVLYQRKIWAQSILPFFSVALIWFWSALDRPWGRMAFVALGLMMGQIHMSAWFFFGALFATSAYNNRKLLKSRAVYLGLALGGFPLIPWLLHFPEFLATPRPEEHRIFLDWKEPVQLKFWVYWFTEAIGLHHGHLVGRDLGGPGLTQLAPLLPYPLLNDRPTYGISLAYGSLIAVGSLILLRIASRFRALKAGLVQSSFTRSLLLAAFLVMGVGLTLTFIAVRRYYLITAYPLIGVSLAFLIVHLFSVRERKWILSVLLFSQLCVLLSIAQFVTKNSGAPFGDYGPSYQSQME